MGTRRASPVLCLILVAGMASFATAQGINHPSGFTGQTDLTFNGHASVQGSRAQLTPAANNQAGSFFSTAQVPIGRFTTRFVFHQLGTPGSQADGIGFCIQRAGPTAVGSGGGAMGYMGISDSVFVKLDNYSNESSTGIYQNGADPSGGSIDMRAAGVDVHSQHDFQVDLAYDGTVLSMTVKDLTTNATFSTSFTVDIAAVIGGATAHVGFTGATGGLTANQEVLSWSYGELPPPTNLTATNGPNVVSLAWTASAGAASYTILRSTTSGGPYTSIATGVAGTTYDDLTAANPNTYFYVVYAVNGASSSSYSNEARGDPLPAPVTARPNTGLFTNENGTTTTFSVTFNTPAPPGGSLVTILSGDTTEGVVSESMFATSPAGGGTGIQFLVPEGFTGGIPITITGVDDAFADGDVAYVVTVTATNMGIVIPDVHATNNDNDAPGITISRTAGLVTTEAGGQDTVEVSLNTEPFGPITMSLTSSNPAEGTVSPASITFTAANWDTPQLVTLTGVDDAVLDFAVAYTILTGALVTTDPNDAAAYDGLKPPDLAAVNLDDEKLPALPRVWGGCGLLGLEIGVALGLAALRRRRRPSF